MPIVFDNSACEKPLLILCFFNLGPKFMSDSILIYKIYKNNKFKVIFFTLKLRKTLVFFYFIMYL